jgi:hypothetical protein
MPRRGPRLGPRDTFITLLRRQMRAFGMNPYRYQGLSATGSVPLGEGVAELERRKAGSQPMRKSDGCPKCGSLVVVWIEGDITPGGRHRLRCNSCGHRFTKDPRFLKTIGPRPAAQPDPG